MRPKHRFISKGIQMRGLRRNYQKHLKEQEKRRKKFRKSTIAAGAAAAITLGSGLSVNRILAAYTPDPHELPVSQDSDADLLANKEEQAIGCNSRRAVAFLSTW